ncbi:RNA-binding domain-containing protein [Microthyrium microscopicum]|uniref:RNA-binding domain-containing protein n=1 Tax=Microthyrium microscopicum TaxID=703497 RepID=A0A6A6U463_9PEZI|nr:RNA-binding domain-containing protein [Microthyrium microscopicum]
MENTKPASDSFLRSRASSNWRTKDTTPTAPITQPRYTQDDMLDNRQFKATSNSTRLYVGNLLYTVQRAQIESFFSDNGFQINNMTMSIDPFTGRNPSYAFVDFATTMEAERAMTILNGKHILGRPVRIRPNIEHAKNKRTFQSRTQVWTGHSNKREYVKEVTNYTPTFNTFERTDASTHWETPCVEGRRIWVGALPRIEPQAAVDAEMQELFNDFLLLAVSKVINPPAWQPESIKPPTNRRFVYIDLATKDEADRAVSEIHGKVGSWGGRVKVRIAENTSNRKVLREQGDASIGQTASLATGSGDEDSDDVENLA